MCHQLAHMCYHFRSLDILEWSAIQLRTESIILNGLLSKLRKYFNLNFSCFAFEIYLHFTPYCFSKLSRMNFNLPNGRKVPLNLSLDIYWKLLYNKFAQLHFLCPLSKIKIPAIWSQKIMLVKYILELWVPFAIICLHVEKSRFSFLDGL